MVLETIQSLLPLAFVVLLSLWLILSLFMIFERLVYERTEGRVRRAIETLSEDHELRGQLENLESLPRRILERVASDSATPAGVAAILASHLVEQTGFGPYVERAGGVRKWKQVAALHILFHAGYDRTLELLDEALASGDRDTVGAAVALAGRFPDTRAAQALIETLRQERYPASRVATALDHFPLPISREILPLLASPDAGLRFWGVTLLARYRDKVGLEAVVSDLARDDDERVRKAVAQTLGAFGRAESAAVLLPLLQDESWIVKAHAARALGGLGRAVHAERVAPLLADDQWWVRLAARESLIVLGSDVSPVLVRYLDHEDRFARNGAAEVLQNLGWLDSMLDAAIAGGAHTKEGGLVKKALTAGGASMAASYVMRQDAKLQPRVAELFDSLGLESAAGT